MKQKHIGIRGIICTLTGAMLWGLSGTCMQYLIEDRGFPVTYMTWTRMFCAGILFIGLMLIYKRDVIKKIIHDRSSIIQLAIFAIFGLLMSQFAYAMTICYTDAGTATVLQCLSTVVLIVYGCCVHRRAPAHIELVATTLAVVATFLIATQGDPMNLSLPMLALVWGLVNACVCAFFAEYPRRLLAQWGSVPVMGCAMVIGCLFITPIAQPWTVNIAWDPSSIAAVGTVAVLGTVVSFSLFLQGVKDLGSVKASLLGVGEPVSASVCTCLLLGTVFTPIDLVAFSMIILMVVIVTLARPHNRSESTSKVVAIGRSTISIKKRVLGVKHSHRDSDEQAA